MRREISRDFPFPNVPCCMFCVLCYMFHVVSFSSLRPHSKHFFDRRYALHGLKNTVLYHRKHTFALCLRLNFSRGRPFKNKLTDCWRYFKHFVNTDTASVAVFTFFGWLRFIKRNFFP